MLRKAQMFAFSVLGTTILGSLLLLAGFPIWATMMVLAPISLFLSLLTPRTPRMLREEQRQKELAAAAAEIWESPRALSDDF